MHKVFPMTCFLIDLSIIQAIISLQLACTQKETFNSFEIEIWLPDFIMGMNNLKNLTVWPVWAELTKYTSKIHGRLFHCSEAIFTQPSSSEQLTMRFLNQEGWCRIRFPYEHYDDVIMTILASQITSLTVVYSIVYSGVIQRKHQSSASLAFVREIHRGPVNFPHKWPVTRKMFPFDDVIMIFDVFYLTVFIISLYSSNVSSKHLNSITDSGFGAYKTCHNLTRNESQLISMHTLNYIFFCIVFV